MNNVVMLFVTHLLYHIMINTIDNNLHNLESNYNFKMSKKKTNFPVF